MNAYCQTPKAVIFVVATGFDGVVRCLILDPAEPGIVIEPKPLLPVVDQIMSHLAAVFESSSGDAFRTLEFAVRSDYSDIINLADGTAATLYIASSPKRLAGINFAKGTFVSIPELLRGMPKNRQRLVYLRAWQVLLGALQDSTKAIDFDEAMKHLNKASETDSSTN